jgi:hypothetical protein
MSDNDGPSDGRTTPDRSGGGDWPLPVDGVTEAVVATPTPDDDWALAALGLHPGEPVTARTWGATRTRRNLDRLIDEATSGDGAGRDRMPAPDAFEPGPWTADGADPAAVVQFVTDPVAFVRASLGRWTADEPVADVATAWVAVGVELVATGTEDGTEWVDWALHPGPSTILERRVPILRRGTAAVVEATVAASRLGVPGEPDEVLRERLDRQAAIVRRTGSERDRAAMGRLADLADGWTLPDG